MSIKINNKEIVGVSKGDLTISYVYKGAVLVWRAIRSCFGNGYWVKEMQWSNEDAWRNNK